MLNCQDYLAKEQISTFKKLDSDPFTLLNPLLGRSGFLTYSSKGTFHSMNLRGLRGP